jgi:hypothetical protein
LKNLKPQQRDFHYCGVFYIRGIFSTSFRPNQPLAEASGIQDFEGPLDSRVRGNDDRGRIDFFIEFVRQNNRYDLNP